MKTLQEIHKIREEKRKELDLRVNTKADTREKHILVCHGTGCTSSKSPQILENFRKILKEKNITNVRVIKTGCFGLCAKGPIVIIRPEDTFYALVTPEDCEEIIEKHIIKGEKVERLLCKDIDGKIVNSLDELNFYKKQKRIALKNCGVINPEEIDEYIAFDGYRALERVLKEMSQEEVIDVIKKSGLRGRGGAGFPTGKKWELTKASEGEQKYVVCNADEGDPGAFMDRSILEGDPHSVLEAMEIAGYTIVDPATIIATHLTEVIKKNAAELLGRQETQDLRDKLKEKHPKIVEDVVPGILDLSTLNRVLQNLLKERVSIRNLQTILEALATYGTMNKDIEYLTEKVRFALRKQITESLLAQDGKLYVFALPQPIEQLIIKSMHPSDEGKEIVIDPATARKILTGLMDKTEEVTAKGIPPVLFVSQPIRFAMRRFVEKYCPSLNIIAHTEVADNVQIDSLGTVLIKNDDNKGQ